jgi:hypothetical protein
MVFPNFKKSILNVSATLSEFLGVPTEHATLDVLKRELAKDYKNVVFLIFDAMGMHPLRTNLAPDDFLMRHIREELTSVFPSTTTNATRTLISAKSPAQHGWFAWSVYFDEINKAIDLFCDRNHYDHSQTVPADWVRNHLPYKPYYFENKSQYEINTILPPFVNRCEPAQNNYFFDILYEQFHHLGEICKKPGKQFVYSYSPQPDKTMHDYGVASPEAKEMIKAINDAVEEFAMEHPDTLIVITADHGQMDVEEAILVWDDFELLNCLAVLPCGDPRAMFVRLKPGQEERFLKHMKTKYGDEVEVFKSKELIEKGVFGGVGGQTHRLGDYIVVATRRKYFRFCELDAEFIGLHTGLTLEEMMVPLIIAGGR